MTLPTTKRAGVCLHVTSLPGEYGIGEIGRASRNFIDAMTEMGLAYWQFLPTGPTAYGDSPYQPLSSFAGNELLIDTENLLQRGLIMPREAQELCVLPHDTVDYGGLIPLKNSLLKAAADRFSSRASSQLKSAYDSFLASNDKQWLNDYALYRVLKTLNSERPWPEWEPHFVHRDAKSLKQLTLAAGPAIEQIKILQFLFHHQWESFRDYARGRGVGLFGDMPIYIALDSADAWARPEILRINRDGKPDSVAGVPPDYFSADGQLWGNPLYNWTYHASENFAWWIDRLRSAAELSDIVRIDHFRGFESYWSVPADAETARYGQWEPGPGDTLFNSIREALGNLPIVAEDLGIITPEVEALRDRHEIPGMKVLQFMVTNPNFSLNDIPSNCVCYTGTHDNDTTQGWFHGSANDQRSPDAIAQDQKCILEATGGASESIHNDLIKLAFNSPAAMAIAPMQDYLGLGSEARLNTPGTSGDNWRWRLGPNDLTPSLRSYVGELTSRTGRHNRA